MPITFPNPLSTAPSSAIKDDEKCLFSGTSFPNGLPVPERKLYLALNRVHDWEVTSWRIWHFFEATQCDEPSMPASFGVHSMPFLPFKDSDIVIHQQQFVYLSSTSVGLLKDDSAMQMYIFGEEKGTHCSWEVTKKLSVLFKHMYLN